MILSMWLSKENRHDSARIPALKHCNWNFLCLELPQPCLWERSLCELLCGGERWKRSSTWHLWHYFPHCYLCFIHSSEAQVSLSKLPLEVSDQMISVDKVLGANRRDSGGFQTKHISFPRMLLHTAPSMLEIGLGLCIILWASGL